MPSTTTSANSSARRSAGSKARSSSSEPAGSSAPTSCESLFAVRRTSTARQPAIPPGGSKDLPEDHVHWWTCSIDSNLDALLNQVQPTDHLQLRRLRRLFVRDRQSVDLPDQFHFVTRLLSRLESGSIACYVHAGSSSEYGDNAAGPTEELPPRPNSDYAVSKVAAANLIYYLRQAQSGCPAPTSASIRSTVRSKIPPG